MRKEYLLKGLRCANCAAKIEREIAKLENVSFVSVSAISSTLSLTQSDDSDIAAAIQAIVHRHEPDVAVIEKEAKASVQAHDHAHDHTHGHTHGAESGKRKIVQLAIGALLFAAGFVLDRADFNTSITAALFIVSYVILGGEVVWRALKNIARGRLFDENFLMSIATLGAFALGEFPEAVAVMLFYQVGEYFQDAAVRKSKKSITDLMDIRPDYANVKVGDELVKADPGAVRVGDIIVARPGEKIPLDGVVMEGESLLDTKSLTGESLPRHIKPGDAVLSGCVNQSGLLTIEVTKPFAESTVSKIIDLVENASGKKAPTENFITTFSRYYTPIVVLLAALLATIPPLLMGGDWSEWINRGLIFLVISCPCALVISIPLGFFGGIGGASRKGILVKGSNYLEALNNLDIVVFDKTGTLTKGVFEVTKVIPAGGYTQEHVLMLAAHAEGHSNHPIAVSIQKAYGKKVDAELLSEHVEVAGHGVAVVLAGKKVLAGNDTLMLSAGIAFSEPQDIGTRVFVAEDGAYAGCILIADQIRPDSGAAIEYLKRRGVRKAVMLTGDNRLIAEKIAAELSLDEVYAQLLPHEKVEKLEFLESTFREASKRPKGKLAFVGDGVNDAPVLARADVGIAMGGLGCDAAIEAADVVLMTDEPSKLADAIDVARFTKRVVWQNITLSLGVKGAFLLLGAFGIATMWEAVFADVGVALLAILNATRVMRMK